MLFVIAVAGKQTLLCALSWKEIGWPLPGLIKLDSF